MLDHQAMTQMMMRRVLVKVNMCVMSKSVKCDMQTCRVCIAMQCIADGHTADGKVDHFNNTIFYH